MRRSLAFQVFVSIAAVALGTLLAVAVVMREVFYTAFATYLRMPHRPMMEPMPPGSPGPGRIAAIGAAERALVTSVDQGVLLAALVAVALAALAAVLLARRLSRPLSRLTTAARAVAAGELEHRVEVEGPGEVEQLGHAFNDMAVSLERAEALRTRLVADVAHELRNPVASLRAQAEGMADGVLPLDDARMRSMVEDLEHLSALVDDLQELSVAEAGKLPYEMGRVDVADLVVREVERAQGSVRPGVAVVAECGGAAEVEGDFRRLSQVLRNLLANSMRHTSEGSVTVRCAAVGGEVVVDVVDTGEGIPAADLPFVFERFYRADAVRTPGSGGVGIGLSIARRIVEDHGGSMHAESEPGVVTKVGFSIPAAVGDA